MNSKRSLIASTSVAGRIFKIAYLVLSVLLLLRVLVAKNILKKPEVTISSEKKPSFC